MAAPSSKGAFGVCWPPHRLRYPRPMSRHDFETIVLVTAAIAAEATLLALFAVFAPE